MKLYDVRAKANNFPHRGIYYDDVWLSILRKKSRKWNAKPEELVEDGVIRSYEMDFVERELFTYEEAQEIKANLEGFSQIVEVRIEEMSLPIIGNAWASDSIGCGRWADYYRFHKDKEWKIVPVLGYYNLENRPLIYSFTSCDFAPDGSVCGDLMMSSDEMKGFIAAYQKAIKTGTKIKYSRDEECQIPKPVVESDSDNSIAV